MRTPSFSLSQDDEFVIVSIDAPHIKVSSVDMVLGGRLFKFHAKPYFMRLTLPRDIVENGSEKAAYDHETGVLTVHLPKAVRGERFPDLDLLAKLLAKPPRDADSPANGISIASVLSGDVELRLDDEQEPLPLSYDWEQQVPLRRDTALAANHYGFMRRHADVLEPYGDEVAEFVDHWPIAMDDTLRRRRVLHEEEQMDLEHYCADFVDDQMIRALIKFRPWWSEALSSDERKVEFSELQRQDMRQLKYREYLIESESEQEKALLLGLIDLLFAYAYDVRTTMAEPTVESGWTMRKLSGQLSWLDEFHTLESVVSCALRRSLAFPLFRHWKLALKVLKDVNVLLKLGKRAVLAALLDMRHQLDRSEQHRLLARIYLDDYCNWLQAVHANKIRSLANALLKHKPERSALFHCADLLELERYAQQHAMLNELD